VLVLRPAFVPCCCQFRRVFQACLNFVSGELSSFYLDAAKDRLYIQDSASSSRRACQTVQAAVLQVRGAGIGRNSACCGAHTQH
jgi:hypothetical protein